MIRMTMAILPILCHTYMQRSYALIAFYWTHAELYNIYIASATSTTVRLLLEFRRAFRCNSTSSSLPSHQMSDLSDFEIGERRPSKILGSKQQP